MPKKARSSAASRLKSSSRSSASVSRSATTRSKPLSWSLWAVSIVISGVFLCLVLSTLLGWRLFIDGQQKLQFAQYTQVEGKLHFSALKPDPDDQGEVKLWAREMGEQDWSDTGVRIPLKQDARWEWTEALPGEIYEFQAELIIDGKTVDRSDLELATAPAYNVVLPIKVTWSDLPEEVTSVSTAKLAGEVVVNGHIPAGSVLEIYTREIDPAGSDIPMIDEALLRQSKRVASVENPQPVTQWEWTAAVPLKTYQVLAVLKNRGRNIGLAAQLVEAEAGEESLKHILNSTAQLSVSAAEPETRVLGTTTSNISGMVTIQGIMITHEISVGFQLPTHR